MGVALWIARGAMRVEGAGSIDPAFEAFAIFGVADGIETQLFFQLVQRGGFFGQALAEGLVASDDIEASDADFGWGIDYDALILDAVLDRFWSIGVDFKAVESAVGVIVMEPGRQFEPEVCGSGCELKGSSFRVDRIFKIVGDKQCGVFGGDRREVPRGFAILEDSFVAVGGTRLEDRSEQIDFATYSADWIEQIGEFREGLHA
jgi:hypothetical protein